MAVRLCCPCDCYQCACPSHLVYGSRRMSLLVSWVEESSIKGRPTRGRLSTRYKVQIALGPRPARTESAVQQLHVCCVTVAAFLDGLPPTYVRSVGNRLTRLSASLPWTAGAHVGNGSGKAASERYPLADVGSYSRAREKYRRERRMPCGATAQKNGASRTRSLGCRWRKATLHASSIGRQG